MEEAYDEAEDAAHEFDGAEFAAGDAVDHLLEAIDFEGEDALADHFPDGEAVLHVLGDFFHHGANLADHLGGQPFFEALEVDLGQKVSQKGDALQAVEKFFPGDLPGEIPDMRFQVEAGELFADEALVEDLAFNDFSEAFGNFQAASGDYALHREASPANRLAGAEEHFDGREIGQPTDKGTEKGE